MQSFEQLTVWQVGLKLVKEVYRLTQTFPAHERFGICSQLRRSSTSILANTAEGFSRYSAADKKHKYMIARSECSETLAFLLVSIELGFCSRPDAHLAVDLSKTTGKLLTGLISSHKTIPTPNSLLPTPNHALR